MAASPYTPATHTAAPAGDATTAWSRPRPRMAWHSLGKLILIIVTLAIALVELTAIMVAASEDADHHARRLLSPSATSSSSPLTR